MNNIPDPYRHDLAIIRETANQICRDLSLDDDAIVFSGNELTAFEELKNQLIPFLEKLVHRNPVAFRTMLYRVDISEKDYSGLITGERVSIGPGLAEMIIRREFQKVLTRRYFGDKN